MQVCLNQLRIMTMRYIVLWMLGQVRNDGIGHVGRRFYIPRFARNDTVMGFAGLGRCWGIVFTLCSQCQALGQALILCRQGRGGWCFGLLSARPPPLWIAGQVRNDGVGVVGFLFM